MTPATHATITITEDDLDLNFPDPETPLFSSHLKNPISWEDWITEMTPMWKNYMAEYDSREQRKRDPAEKRFVL